MQKYEVGVFFITEHIPEVAHIEAISRLAESAKRIIVIFEGLEQPRNIIEPFEYLERVLLFNQVFSTHNRIKSVEIFYRGIYKNPYHPTEKIQQIQSIITEATGLTKFGLGTYKVAYLAPTSKASDLYQDLGWSQLDGYEEDFRGESLGNLEYLWAGGELYSHSDSYVVTPPVVKYLKEFELCNPAFLLLQREHSVVSKYQQSWAAAPYPPIFVTCDAMVIQSGNVLLIQRESAPGEGQWAFPGGFLNRGERIIDGIIRELVEETKIAIPEKVLRGSIQNIQVFDYPWRSLRGRTITHAAMIYLEGGLTLPKVKGSDDAAHAAWFTLAEFANMREKMFEDHHDMGRVLLTTKRK